jgi:predicted Zn-dependent protease
LAEVALASGRPDQAIARLDPLVRQAPFPEAQLLLARAWAEIDANRSLPLLEKVFETTPENREAWELWIDIMAAAGREDQAVERLERHVARRPGAASLQLLLGQLYVNRGALARAEGTFRQTLDKSASDPEIEKRARYSLGYLWVSLGRSEEGERALRQVLNKDDAYLPALTALADLLINVARLDEADQVLARARKLAPENAEVLVLAGRYELRRKKPARAAELLSNVVRAHPEHIQAHFFLGQALKDTGRLEEAKRHLALFQELRKKKRAEIAGRRRGLAVEGIK